MPTIKPRSTQKHFVRHITRLYRENNETLYAYKEFIGEDTVYILNQLIDTVLAKDRDYQAWRAEHSESFVPKPGSRPRGRSRPFGAGGHAQPRALAVSAGSER